MKKIAINGEAVRSEREKRAWTQEELSERTRLGVRTVRRLEAGHASLDTLRRVTEALDMKPETVLPPEIGIARLEDVQHILQVDPLMIELSTDLVTVLNDSDPFVAALIARITSVRRHIALELGILLPGVRVRDNTALPPGAYRLCVRDIVQGEGTLVADRCLALGRHGILDGLDGALTTDPTYGLPGRWIAAEERVIAEARGCLVFNPVSVLATHLTEVIRTWAWQLLGLDEIAALLERLNRPHLVDAVVPIRVTLATLRTVLCDLLRERIPLRDLALILEAVAELSDPATDPARLAESIRPALGEWICREWADREGTISAIVVDPSWSDLDALKEPLRAECQRLRELGLTSVVVTPAPWRRRVRNGQCDRLATFLAWSDIPVRYRVRAVTTLTPQTEPGPASAE